MYWRERIQIEEIAERILHLSYFNLLSAKNCTSRYIEISSTNKKNRDKSIESISVNHLKQKT